MRAGAETAALTAAALLAALLLFGGFVALRGVDPLAVYAALFVGAFGTRFSLEDTLTQAAPLMLTALCTAVPARAGLLVIGGEDDRWTPPRFQHYLVEHLPNARLIMLPETGHYPFVERPDRFNAEVEQFLEGLT